MSANLSLNGCDYLMLGFDHELRRLGFSGNSCQIILELGAMVSPDRLQKRLAALHNRWPILGARPGGFLRPRWKVPRSVSPNPHVRTHKAEPQVCQRLFNEPLDLQSGELLRFDLVEREKGARLLFTWAHALMDAPSAEYFLALVGREDLELPIGNNGQPQPLTKSGLVERLKLAWKTLHRIDKMGATPPRSLGSRQPQAPTQLRYRVEKFSGEETQAVRANGVRLGGVLGAAQYHAAVAMVELNRLHARLGSPSASYVLPVPVGLRPKGTFEPIFSNQVTMLMTQFLPEHLASVENALASLKTQLQEALRSNLLESGRVLSDLFRFLPLRIYMAVLKKGLRGEICSLFYGDTASVNPHLTSFLGAPIEDFVHVAAITPSPGVGVIFYYFQGNLRLTVLHLLTVISEEEAAEFAANLRKRLLNP